MRVNLITLFSAQQNSKTWPIPVSLMIRPSCGLPGDYLYSTDISKLISMLRKQTDLPAAVINKFEAEMLGSSKASLLGVELDERVLTEIGFFVD
jgi:hypothetical protein